MINVGQLRDNNLIPLVLIVYVELLPLLKQRITNAKKMNYLKEEKL